MADERIIVALDVTSLAKVEKIVTDLGNEISFYKVGMELYYSAGNATVCFLRERGKKVFLDLKLHDIPNTVAQSMKVLTKLGVDFVTVHAQGGREMMTAAVIAAQEAAAELSIPRVQILAVTALTSFSEEGWREMGGINPIENHVIRLAKLAKDAGVDGVIASPQEAALIRQECGLDFFIVTPGIRPVFAVDGDQKRVATPSLALQNGASHLVIGRPIMQAIDPVAAVRMIAAEIKEASV